MSEFVSITPDDLFRSKQEARRLALQDLGDKPSQAAYMVDLVSEYPKSVVTGLAIALITIVIGAWAVSATKVAYLAYHESMAALPSPLVAGLTAFVLVMLAELTVLGSLIAKKVLFETDTPANQFPRRVLNAVAWFATGLTISASVAVTGAHVKVSSLSFENAPVVIFVALEACIPLIVLGVSLALEQLILKQIKERQHALIRYNRDVTAWNKSQREIESSEGYDQHLLRAVYEAWVATNSVGRGRNDRLIKIQNMSDTELETIIRGQMQISPLARPRTDTSLPPASTAPTVPIGTKLSVSEADTEEVKVIDSSVLEAEEGDFLSVS